MGWHGMAWTLFPLHKSQLVHQLYIGALGAGLTRSESFFKLWMEFVDFEEASTAKSELVTYYFSFFLSFLSALAPDKG